MANLKKIRPGKLFSYDIVQQCQQYKIQDSYFYIDKRFHHDEPSVITVIFLEASRESVQGLHFVMVGFLQLMVKFLNEVGLRSV